ncbi:UDP-N-acetylmuramoyl-tripeptide--D-alanyl-D-alanine ligase [Candidatus Saccharibacteria bacterium]|nr:UDP-N-acetylmuramoyl-tripeptide--D-alanyl-D-alanine ligase [Candidatus Saccharibacteria bacterium]
MKKLAKKIVVTKLGYQLRKLKQKNDFKVVAVVGSIGKTSTKLAIARVLSSKYKVCYQDGNYNDIVTVPLIFFGQKLPSLFNPIAWLILLWNNKKQLRRKYPFDVVIIELGSDGPGQIAEFKQYLDIDIAVVTAIAPEHMANFSSLDDVAREELAVAGFSKSLLANADLCGEYIKRIPKLASYGKNPSADFMLKPEGKNLIVTSKSTKIAQIEDHELSGPEQYSLLAAAAVANKLGMTPDEIKTGITNIKPVPGRMQKLGGINGSTIIDDTYNASPEATKLALDTLYKAEAPQKIAVLGNMNEMGEMSEAVHKEVGSYCDPKQLDLVITIGPDANLFLAPAASAKGCKVEMFNSPYNAGTALKPLIKKGALILFKGSQNGVFAEEAVKILLADPTDGQKLVRQSPDWMAIKQKAFGE